MNKFQRVFLLLILIIFSTNIYSSEFFYDHEILAKKVFSYLKSNDFEGYSKLLFDVEDLKKLKQYIDSTSRNEGRYIGYKKYLINYNFNYILKKQKAAFEEIAYYLDKEIKIHKLRTKGPYDKENSGLKTKRATVFLTYKIFGTERYRDISVRMRKFPVIGWKLLFKEALYLPISW